MDWHLPAQERTYLRELARRQADIAALPVMQQRRRMWYDLNDGRAGARPPVVIETATFAHDFMPEAICKCQSPTGRRIERQLLSHLRNHELIDDDKVVPDTFDIGWFTDINELGLTIKAESVPDCQGFALGYRYEHPIKDLKRDLDLLKPARCSVDRDRTGQWQAFLSDLLGEFLPVCIRTGTFGCNMLTHRVVELMGMEAFFLAMHDTPDLVHRLMAFLRDNSLRVMRWAESEGLLRQNTGNQDSFGSSFDFTTKLGEKIFERERVSLSDMWGSANSQETVGISPQMYHEFCFPYYRDACAPLGLLYYGCCEPPHHVWEDVRRYPHLKKVSVNRWTDQDFMGEALQCTDIVFSRKPNPNLLGVDVTLNEQAWAQHIRETLDASRGVFLELIIRDVYTVHGNLGKAKRAVEIARGEVDRHYRSR